MIDTLCNLFLFTYADRRKRVINEPVSITEHHKLSVWVDEDDLRNKFKLAMENSQLEFEEVTLVMSELVDHCIIKDDCGDQVPNTVFQFLTQCYVGKPKRRPKLKLVWQRPQARRTSHV